jgi:hypothetical protein
MKKEEPREYQKYQSWCNDFGIVIYPKVFSTQKYKIIVCIREKETIGEKTYPKDPKPNEENWGDAIRKLYKSYYELNFKDHGTN